ncbi:10383_t:CDS:2, partial [Dentiscutata heterogama]
TNPEIDKKYQDLFEVLSEYYEKKNFLIYSELIKHYSEKEDLFDEYKCVVDPEIKKNITMDQISQLKYTQNHSKEALTISKFFDRDKASPNDLILSGIIFNEEIQDKQKAIYEALKNESLWDSFCLPKLTMIGLSLKYQDFLLEHLNNKIVRIPFSNCEHETIKFELFHIFAKKLKDIWNDSQYKSQDSTITESTFCCQFVIHLVEFLQGYTGYTFQTAWNSVESVATKYRNNQDGPRRCPDNFWFFTSQKIKNLRYEFFYLEISGGPFANLENVNVKSHILENRKRIGKFCTTLMVYEIERKFDPLFHMKELVNINLPVHKPSENEFITFLEKLITVSDLFKQSLDNILIIESLLCEDEYDGYSSNDDTDLNLLFTENTMKF